MKKVNNLNKKEIGEYYTPKNLAINMVKKIRDDISNSDILEPSVGDGIFLEPLMQYNPKSIDCVELFQKKCDFITNQYNSDKLNVICSDFIDYSLNCKKKYDIIIGNPPYIKKSNINEDVMTKSKKLLKCFQIVILK